MLTIQPNISLSKTAFRGQKQLTPEEIQAKKEQEYEETRNELIEQRDTFNELVESEEYNLPKPINKALKGGAIVTTGLIGGMAAGWGTGKTIEGFQKLIKTKPVQKFLAKIKSLKLPKIEKGSKLDNILTKIKNNKVVKPVIDFFKSIKNKIKGVKTETYKNAAVNTVGVSGGIASGVEAIKKDKNEAGEE